MIPIEEIFSKQEIKVYKNLPLATIFYLFSDNNISAIFKSDGFNKLFHIKDDIPAKKIVMNIQQKMLLTYLFFNQISKEN